MSDPASPVNRCGYRLGRRCREPGSFPRRARREGWTFPDLDERAL